MIETLFPINELKVVSPPRMDIGSFYVFKEIENPFGRGQQAVHNSGSSMLKDTPKFKKKVISFIEEHFAYSDTNVNDVYKFIENQVKNLIKFKNNIEYRKKVLEEIFPEKPFLFNYSIKADYLYISLILFFVREYNYLQSTHKAHSLTKNKTIQYYKNKNIFLSEIYTKLINLKSFSYITDVCFGRYYFLEVHFLEKNTPRAVPLTIVYEYLLIKNKNLDAFDLKEQQDIFNSTIVSSNELDKLGNREPVKINTGGSKRYKTNPKIAKTVLKLSNYKCMVDENHTTFYTKKQILFTEAHHLIPISFQDNYLPINIDRKENIVSLCPTCHRAVHLGNIDEKKNRLKVLFDLKKSELEKVGIEITFEDLMNYYK